MIGWVFIFFHNGQTFLFNLTSDCDTNEINPISCNCLRKYMNEYWKDIKNITNAQTFGECVMKSMSYAVSKT